MESDTKINTVVNHALSGLINVNNKILVIEEDVEPIVKEEIKTKKKL